MMFIMGLGALALLASLPDTIETRITFTADDFAFQEVQSLDFVSAENTYAIGKEGYPSLPRLPLIFVIPAGSTVGSVSGTVVGSPEELDGTYDIWPSQPVVPVSWTDTIPTSDPDSTVYELESFWPEVVCQAIEVGSIDGIEFARVDVFPVAWNPSTGKLRLRGTVDISLEVIEDTLPAADPVMMTNVFWERRIEELSRLIVNPDDLESFAVSPVEIPEDSLDRTDRPELIDCLIVTKEAWTNAWQPLADWNVRRGLYTEILTLEEIDDGAGLIWAEGRDWAETVRNSLRWFHENEGVQYVLIGVDSRPRGATSIPTVPFDVPSRFCVAWYWLPAQGIFQNTDWYYACLDENLNWNTNGDPSKWGEYDPDDPESNDYMDLLPEVALGRLPAHSYEEAAASAARSVNYQHHLPVGSELDLDILICSASAYKPGFPETWQHMSTIFESVPDTYSDTLWLAELSCLLDDWERISVEAVLWHLDGSAEPGGAYRANFGGHGGFNWLAANPSGIGPGQGNVFKVLADQLRTMSGLDGMFCTAWAFNCGTGNYAHSESEETICETWVGCDTNLEDAPLAGGYVGNAHHGLNSPNPEGSASHQLNGWFNNSLYNSQPGTGTWGQGDAFNLAKIVYAFIYTNGYPAVIPPPLQCGVDSIEPMWDLKGANLMGDPCCPVWLSDPINLTVQHPSVFRCPGDFTVRVQDSGTAPVEGARVCLFLESGFTFEIYSRGFTDQHGIFSSYLDPSVGGEMYVTVTKQNHLPCEGSATLLL